MKRFVVTFTEKVRYEVVVEADSWEEAKQKVEDGEFNEPHVIDSWDLEIEDVEEE